MKNVAQIISRFREVSGIQVNFVKDEILSNPYIVPSTIGSDYDPLYSHELSNAFYKEVNHYLDKALYQYIISRTLISSGRLSWGAVTQYYSNFFAISGLTRLHEFGYMRIGNISCELIHETNEQYKIKKIKADGLHRSVWKKFYELFRNFDYKKSLYERIYKPYDGNMYFESDRRNDINYYPGKGYGEIYLNSAKTKKIVNDVNYDAYNDIGYIPGTDWPDIDVSTQYRIRLLANIIYEIDRVNIHKSVAKERSQERNKFIERLEVSTKYKRRYLTWLEGC